MSGDSWLGEKRCVATTLSAYPAHCEELFKRLKRLGPVDGALFGGALRDADLGAYWAEPRAIKDYDVRLWMPIGSLSGAWEQSLAKRISEVFEGAVVELTPSAGTGRLRHVAFWQGIEMDISAREAPAGKLIKGACAMDRAMDSDASLSAIAIDFDLNAWCEAQYEIDRARKRLSFYPQPDQDRAMVYRQRMIGKFPHLNARDLSAPPPVSLSGSKGYRP